MATVKAFADVFGGRPRKWSEQNQFQVKIPVTRLPIVLLPGQNISQFMELWAGSTCQRRCDSVMQQNGDPCACDTSKPITGRACKPVTRLMVAVPEVDTVVGTGLLVTRSGIAAAEMAGQLSLASDILSAGRAVRAVLRIDQLTTPGHSFIVPRLELVGLSFAELAQAANTPELAAPAPAELTQGE